MNGNLQTVAGRTALRLERRLRHSPQKVWRALTEPVNLNQWFPFDVEIDLKLGSKVNFIEKGCADPSSDGVITELDPPRLIAYSWGEDLLRWELRPEGEGCLLIFTHTFADRAGAASFAAGWQVCLDGMETVLDGKPVDAAEYAGPDWGHQMARLHEAYIDFFGLSAGAVEVTTAGWQVRFERQLTKPITEVWNRLTAGSAPIIGDAPPKGLTTGAVQAGAVTTVAAPHLLEYEWQVAGRPAGRVRWELTDGTGHGARLILTQTGGHESTDQQPTVLAVWQQHIEGFAKGLLES